MDYRPRAMLRAKQTDCPRPCRSPYNIDRSSADFGVAAHDGDTGCKGAVDAEHHKLRPLGQNCDVAVCVSVVTPERETGIYRHKDTEVLSEVKCTTSPRQPQIWPKGSNSCATLG